MTRQTLFLKITTESPLMLAAAPPAQNLVESLDFIPGNTIRGLLANRYLRTPGKSADDLFQRLFVSGDTIFGPAQIKGGEAVPLSARTCKYAGGFRNDDGGHGVTDLLLADKGDIRSCAKCGKPLDYHKGYFDPTKRNSLDVKMRRITRTAIDPLRGTASTGLLYSQQVIEEGQEFYAAIECPEPLKPPLIVLIKDEFTARLGTGKSRGQGWVKVSQSPTPIGIDKNTAQRFKQFQERKKELVLAVTLLSEALFIDDYLRDLTAPNIRHLAPLGINPDEWEQEPATSYADTRLVSGFDGYPIRLPRPVRMAVCAGSAFLFRTKAGRLPTTIPTGSGVGWIGDKCREGFGLTALWHPFHLQPDKEA